MEERVLSEGPDGRVVERTIRRYSQDGRPGQTERIRIEERLAKASSLNPSVMRFKNSVNYYGQCASMDGQGRVLIHPLLREKAGTQGEVAVLGQQEFLEVWNRAAFEERLERDPLTDEDLAILAESGI